MFLTKSLHKKKVRVSKLALPLVATGIVGTFVALSINRRQKTAEQGPSRILECIEQSDDQIALTWPDSGGFYHLYRDGELLYQGKLATFNDQNLSPGTVYTYSIANVDASGKEVVTIKIQTATSVINEERSNIFQDSLLTTIVTKDKISMEWEQIPGVSEYDIYRNDQHLQNVKNCSFIDETAQDNEEYTYTIKAKRPMQRSDQVKSEATSLVANAVGIIKKDSSVELAAHEEFTITKKVGPRTHLLKPIEAEKDHCEKNWQLRYTTFLKAVFVNFVVF